jgi:polar amino acid transport system permease protein
LGELHHTHKKFEQPEEIVDESQKKTLATQPWWLFAMILMFLYMAWSIYTKENLQEAFNFIIRGLGTTIFVAIISYILAVFLGLITGLGRISRNVVIRNIATFYVEFVRGIPMLVLILFIGFVGVPIILEGLESLGFGLISTKSVPKEARGIVALALTYGAFIAEIFRAGIQSIGRGQMEAARSLGMPYGKAMRYVILPQAVRNVLPALGNDFVAMVKDSAMVSLLAVGELTYNARVYAGSSFRYREAYTILAILYLLLTVILSRFLSVLEKRLRKDER